jgi:hypothetical protein
MGVVSSTPIPGFVPREGEDFTLDLLMAMAVGNGLCTPPAEVTDEMWEQLELFRRGEGPRPPARGNIAPYEDDAQREDQRPMLVTEDLFLTLTSSNMRLAVEALDKCHRTSLRDGEWYVLFPRQHGDGCVWDTLWIGSSESGPTAADDQVMIRSRVAMENSDPERAFVIQDHVVRRLGAHGDPTDLPGVEWDWIVDTVDCDSGGDCDSDGFDVGCGDFDYDGYGCACGNDCGYEYAKYREWGDPNLSVLTGMPFEPATVTVKHFDCHNMTAEEEQYYDDWAAEETAKARNDDWDDAGEHADDDWDDAGEHADDRDVGERSEDNFVKSAIQQAIQRSGEARVVDEERDERVVDEDDHMSLMMRRAQQRTDARAKALNEAFDRIMHEIELEEANLVTPAPAEVDVLPGPPGPVPTFDPDNLSHCGIFWTNPGNELFGIDHGLLRRAEEWNRLVRLFLVASTAADDSTAKRRQSVRIVRRLLEEPGGDDAFRSMCQVRLTMSGELPPTLTRRSGMCQYLNRPVWELFNGLFKERNPFKLAVITCYPLTAVGKSMGRPMHLKDVPADDTENDGHYVVLFTGESPATARVLDLSSGHRNSLLEMRFHSLTEYLRVHIQSFDGDVGTVRLGEHDTGEWYAFVDISTMDTAPWE